MKGNNLAEVLVNVAVQIFIGGVVLALVAGALIGSALVGVLVWWIR